MKIIFRITCVIIYLLLIALIYLSTIDKYDVIYERNPDLLQGSLGNNNGNGVVSSGVFLFVILMFQCVFFFVGKIQSLENCNNYHGYTGFLFFLYQIITSNNVSGI